MANYIGLGPAYELGGTAAFRNIRFSAYLLCGFYHIPVPLCAKRCPGSEHRACNIFKCAACYCAAVCFGSVLIETTYKRFK